MENIGNYELLAVRTLIVPAGTTAAIHADVSGWSLKISIKFENDSPEREMGVGIRGVGNEHAILTFTNWNNPLGTAMKEPGYIGSGGVGPVGLFFMAAHWLIGDTNKIDIQLMVKRK